MADTRAIGVDLGGTKILAGLVDSEGRVHATVQRETPTGSLEALLDALEGVVSALGLAIELEGHCYSRLRQSDDFREGVEAFHAKRPARFKGT